jgi:hypothetical protein
VPRYHEDGSIDDMDREPGHFLMGCQMWEAALEGQAGGSPPEPGGGSWLPSSVCPRCGEDPLSDKRHTCALCLKRLDDAELRAARRAKEAQERFKLARGLARFRPKGATSPEARP